MKSKKILPERDRNKFVANMSSYELIEYLTTYSKALEDAEEEVEFLLKNKSKLREELQNLSDKWQETFKTLLTENQALKQSIESNHGGNCIIAPKDEVDKVAKERYEKAVIFTENNGEHYKESVNGIITEGMSYSLDIVKQALKISAGYENK